MKIGLVLPEVPQYSETFFNFKINGLVESGFEVLLFTGSKGNSKNRVNEKVKRQQYLSVFFICLCSISKIYFLTKENIKSN